MKGLVLGDKNCQIFAESFFNNRTLTYLNLSKNELTHDALKALEHTLRDSGIRHLDLSHNPLGDAGIDDLCNYIGDKNCKLEKLNISHTKFKQHGGFKLFGVVSRKSENPKYLNVSHNSFSQKNMDKLGYCI
jgi:Ran GTPase-activating protein (RanGAP) involved in mRNA processing and transport